MNVLLTGGAGFVGSYLCREMLKSGHDVRIVDCDPKGVSNPDYDLRVVDILAKEQLRGVMKDIDLVLHLAAKHRFFGISEQEFFRINEEGTKNVLEEMDESGVSKLVFFSTVAVYGETNSSTDESTRPKPNTPYGRSKLSAEALVRKWAQNNASRTAVIIRPTVVFGPYNKGNIYRLIRQIHRRAYIPIGEGDNIKSIAYVENVAAATLFLVNQGIQGVEIFNYADLPHMRYKEIVDVIYRGLGRKAPSYYLPVNPMLKVGHIVDKAISKSRIEFSVKTIIHKMNKSTYHRADKIRALGFVPKYSSKEGLERMINWYVASKINKTRGETDEH